MWNCDTALTSVKEGFDLMDYYQGVVIDYLRADRSVFINTECSFRSTGREPPKAHWYCDAVAVDSGQARLIPAVYLCEVTYSENLSGLIKKLKAWNDHWQEICKSLVDNCH